MFQKLNLQHVSLLNDAKDVLQMLGYNHHVLILLLLYHLLLFIFATQHDPFEMLLRAIILLKAWLVRALTLVKA